MIKLSISDYLFYGIAIIGFIFVFSGLYSMYEFRVNQMETQIQIMESHPIMIPNYTNFGTNINNTDQTNAFNTMLFGIIIVFADVFWYEIYFHTKVLRKNTPNKNV